MNKRMPTGLYSVIDRNSHKIIAAGYIVSAKEVA